MGLVSVWFLIFMAAVTLVYYLVPQKGQWIVLLLASLSFYGLCAKGFLVCLLLFAVIVYLFAKRFETDKKPLLVLLEIILLIALVIVLKYAGWFGSGLEGALGWLGSFHAAKYIVPLGISYIMLMGLGYSLDVYRGTIHAEGNFLKVLGFLVFFPALTQGPINRFADLVPQMEQGNRFRYETLVFGVQRMLWGFFKKLVIADRIAVAIGTLKGTEYTGVSFFVLTVFYAVQIYGDFTGGIDIAIGVGETLGVKMPENFIRPFFSKNIAEYWRRWHISLNEWMKSYIFYPITVSGPMLKLALKTRAKLGRFGMRIPVYIGSLLTWLGTGVWHGFNFHFILWGLINCVVIVISEELNPAYDRFHNRFSWSNKRGYDVFQIIRMFVLMNLIRATDLFNDVGDYFRRIGSLAWEFNFHVLWDGTMMNLGLSVADYIILICGIIIMFLVSFFSRDDVSFRVKFQKVPRVLRYVLLFLLLLSVILFGSYGIGYDASSFIYNQF